MKKEKETVTYNEVLTGVLSEYKSALQTLRNMEAMFVTGVSASCPHRKEITVHAIAPSPENSSNYHEKGICRKGRESTKLEYMWINSVHNCPDCKIDICPLLTEPRKDDCNKSDINSAEKDVETLRKYRTTVKKHFADIDKKRRRRS